MKTERAANKIFDESNRMVMGELSKANQRVDEVVAYHKTQKELFDSLTVSN